MKSTAEQFADWLNNISQEVADPAEPQTDAAQTAYPDVKDGGECLGVEYKPSAAEQFAEWLGKVM